MKHAGIYILVSALLLSSCKEHNTPTNTPNTDSTVTGSAIAEDTLTNSGDATHSFIHEYCKDGNAAPIAQPIEHPSAALAEFVPKGYFIWDTCKGDLNRDKYPDMLLVLQQYGEDTITSNNENEYHRPLLVLTGQGNNTYKLAARNDSAVYAHDRSGWGECYTGLSIKHGYFSIESGIHGGQHWDGTETFKYNQQDGKWYLYKIIYEDWHDDPNNPDAEPLSIHNAISGTDKKFGAIPFEKYNRDFDYLE